MPWVRPFTTVSLRFIIAGKSNLSPSQMMPCCANLFCAWENHSLESSRALLGMQPILRQVPPSVGIFSTQATRRPSCAARIAPTYPPGPAPITKTSKRCVSAMLPIHNSVRLDKGLKPLVSSNLCLSVSQSQQHPRWVFDTILDPPQEQHSPTSIDDTVVI